MDSDLDPAGSGGRSPHLAYGRAGWRVDFSRRDISLALGSGAPCVGIDPRTRMTDKTIEGINAGACLSGPAEAFCRRVFGDLSHTSHLPAALAGLFGFGRNCLTSVSYR